jgi:hypothetical protein
MPYPTETIEIFIPFNKLQAEYGLELGSLTLKATWQSIEALAESLCNTAEVDLEGYTEILRFPFLAQILGEINGQYEDQNLMRLIADCL